MRCVVAYSQPWRCTLWTTDIYGLFLPSGSFWEFIRNILMDVFDRSLLNVSRAGNYSKNQSKWFDQPELSDWSRSCSLRSVSGSPTESGHWLVPCCTFTEANSLKQVGFHGHRHQAERELLRFRKSFFLIISFYFLGLILGLGLLMFPVLSFSPHRGPPPCFGPCGIMILYLEITDSV